MNTSEFSVPDWLQPQWRRLQGASKSGRAGHAILFSGPKGVGKHRLAAELIRLALCDQSDEVACGACRSCTVAAAGNHPDYHRLVVPEDKSTIGIEQVRALSAQVALSPSYQNRKIGLVHPAEAMTHAAANALLKTLEEPPGNTLMVLISHDAWRLPATIVSRCQIVNCAVPHHQQAVSWLNEYTGEAGWEMSLELANNAPFLAIEYKKQGIEKLFESTIEELIGLKDGSKDLVTVAKSWSEGHRDVRLSGLFYLLKGLIEAKLGVEGELAHKSRLEPLRSAVGQIKLSALLGYQDAVLKSRARLDTSLNAQMQMESLLAPWVADFSSYTLERIAT